MKTFFFFYQRWMEDIVRDPLREWQSVQNKVLLLFFCLTKLFICFLFYLLPHFVQLSFLSIDMPFSHSGLVSCTDNFSNFRSNMLRLGRLQRHGPIEEARAKNEIFLGVMNSNTLSVLWRERVNRSHFRSFTLDAEDVELFLNYIPYYIVHCTCRGRKFEEDHCRKVSRSRRESPVWENRLLSDISCS